MRSLSRFLAALLVAPITIAAPQGSDPVRLRSDTHFVEIDVTARDESGRPVEGLKREDFGIFDSGKPRPFTVFREFRVEPATARPTASVPQLPPNTFTNIGRVPETQSHSTVILIDAINDWFDNYGPMQQGVLGMLSKIPADERIALYVIAKQEGLVQLADYTTDRERLRQAIANYAPHSMCQAPPGFELAGDGLSMPMAGRGAPSASDGAESAAQSLAMRKGQMAAQMGPLTNPCIGQDNLLRASESVRLALKTFAEQLRDQPGRKSLFWMTQGFPPARAPIWNKVNDSTDDTPWKNTIAELNRSNVAVNTVDNNGLGGPPRLWGKGTILPQREIAADTGGRSFYGRNDLDAALAEGIAESRAGYVLGFYLAQVDNKFHDLKVTVDKPGVVLSYRQGYSSTDDQKVTVKKTELETALMNPTGATDVGIIANVARLGSDLSVKIRLTADSLSLQQAGGGWAGRIEELFIERNAANRVVGRLETKGDFTVTPENRASFDQTGPIMTQKLPYRADAVKLDIVVRDTASGKTGSLTIPLEPNGGK